VLDKLRVHIGPYTAKLKTVKLTTVAEQVNAGLT